MALKLYNDTDIQNIADSIRAKKSSTNTMLVSEMASEIDSIPTGITPTGTLAISQNGTYDVTNYASANVNVSGGASFSITSADGLFFAGARMDIQSDLLPLIDWDSVTSCQCMYFDCSALTSIDVSSFDTINVTTMQQMFYNCSSLLSLDLSAFDLSNVENLNSLVCKCSRLKNLVIGKNTSNYSKITNSALLFSGCSALDSVTINGTTVLPITNSNAFQNLKSTCKFYVPSNLVDSYKSATNWSKRASYIYAIS